MPSSASSVTIPVFHIRQGRHGMIHTGELISEGKSKRIYATDDPEKAIVYFKD